MVILGLELVKHILKVARLINQEARSYNAHVFTSHELFELPNTVLLAYFVLFISKQSEVQLLFVDEVSQFFSGCRG